MSDTCTIPANPDVPGQGVRIAIYAQNLLCFLPVIMHLWDRRITKGEMKAVKDQSIGMLAIAFAILITTIVQVTGRHPSITNYHATLILNLSLMNNTSAWIWFNIYVQYRSKKEKPTPPTWEACYRVLLKPLRKWKLGWMAAATRVQAGRNG